MPMAKEVSAMIVFLRSKPHSPSMVTPDTMIAPNMIVKRLTTFVMATSPTF